MCVSSNSPYALRVLKANDLLLLGTAIGVDFRDGQPGHVPPQ